MTFVHIRQNERIARHDRLRLIRQESKPKATIGRCWEHGARRRISRRIGLCARLLRLLFGWPILR